MFRAVAIIREAAEKHNFTPREVDLRWLKHHPTLDASMGDAIMVGTSSAKHLERNLEDLEKEPLFEDVVAGCRGSLDRHQGCGQYRDALRLASIKYWLLQDCITLLQIRCQ